MRGGEGGLVRVLFMGEWREGRVGIMFWAITEKGEEFLCVVW